jgi:prepilin-type N-terminal cleavage/methylation domain-containing protein
MRARRGFTLLEMLMVVAIMGVMSALATASIIAATQLGRVNGAATTVAALLTTTRTRALTEHCTYVLQLNGPTYNPLAAPVDVLRRPNTALLYRKNNCASTVGAYEGGAALPDRLVQEMALQDFNVDLTFPPGILAAGRLGSGSVSIGWLGNGTSRITVFADPTGSGASTDTGLALGPNITVTPMNITSSPPTRVIAVNATGASKAL